MATCGLFGKIKVVNLQKKHDLSGWQHGRHPGAPGKYNPHLVSQQSCLILNVKETRP